MGFTVRARDQRSIVEDENGKMLKFNNYILQFIAFVVKKRS